jgi:Ran GTPase-activating protein (RanGAP) involved in mRNA processing and transport
LLAPASDSTADERTLPRAKYYGALKKQIQHKRALPAVGSTAAAAAYSDCCNEMNPQQRQQQRGVVNLEHYSMGNEAAIALANGLRVIELPISSVNLAGNRISRMGASALLNTMRSEHLQELNLSDNKIGSKGVEGICRLLGPGSQLRVLNLNNNALGDRLVRMLAQSIAGSKERRLRELHLKRNKIAVRGAEALAELLLPSASCSLEVLLLGWNEINAKAATALAKGLEVNMKLVTLDLAWNCFGGTEVRLL